MTVPSFDEIMAFCETQAREWLIDTKKELAPTWLLFRNDAGTDIVVTPWHNDFEKQVAFADIRLRLTDPQIVAYAMYTEMWVSTAQVGQVTRDGRPGPGYVRPSKDPKRREGVICYASTLTEREQRMWEIVRDYKGTVRMLRSQPDATLRGATDDPHMAGTIPSMFRDAGRL